MEEQTLEELLVALSLLPAMTMMLPLMNMVRNLSPYPQFQKKPIYKLLDIILHFNVWYNQLINKSVCQT